MADDNEMKSLYIDLKMQKGKHESQSQMRRRGVLGSVTPALTEQQQAYVDAVDSNIYSGNTGFDLLSKDYVTYLGRGKKRRKVETTEDFREANPKYQDWSDDQVQEAIQEYFKKAGSIISDLWSSPPAEVVERYRGLKTPQSEPEPNLSNKVDLHPDYGNWEQFLSNQTDLVEERNSWKHYVSSNSHYIVSPEGNVATYHGIQGKNAFERLSGSRAELAEKDMDNEKLLADEKLLATENLRGETYEYRVTRKPVEGAPQLTHQIQMRIRHPDGSTSEWESAMLGGMIRADKAPERFLDRFRGSLSNITAIDPELSRLVAEREEVVRKVEQEREEKQAQQQQENIAYNERVEDILQSLKGVKFTQQETQITGADKKILRTVKGLGLKGLVITPESEGKYKKYGITHQQSGGRILGGLSSLRDAKVVAYRLADRVDWTQSAADVKKAVDKSGFKFVHELAKDPFAELPDVEAVVVEKPAAMDEPQTIIATPRRYPTKEDNVELINLYHLARAAGKNTKYERMLWASAAFAKEHEGWSSTSAYKALDETLRYPEIHYGVSETTEPLPKYTTEPLLEVKSDRQEPISYPIVTREEILEVQASRTPQSRHQDSRKESKRTVSNLHSKKGQRRARAWLKHPGRYDVQGVDTPSTSGILTNRPE